MRFIYIFLFLFLCSCRSETGERILEVTTDVTIGLASEALYGNLASFSGLHTTVPDLFVGEEVIKQGEKMQRVLLLNDGSILYDRLDKIDDQNMVLHYTTYKTTWPIQEIVHHIRVIPGKENMNCKVIWTSAMRVQNRYREQVKSKLSGIQEAYLFSLVALGEELEQLLNDDDF